MPIVCQKLSLCPNYIYLLKMKLLELICFKRPSIGSSLIHINN